LDVADVGPVTVTQELMMLRNKKLLCTGIGGSVVTAICCFTPILVVLLGAVGLSAWLGWIDYVLLPALGLFLLLTVYALYRHWKRPEAAAAGSEEEASQT
jgi:mercuric ion transport protein